MGPKSMDTASRDATAGRVDWGYGGLAACGALLVGAAVALSAVAVHAALPAPGRESLRSVGEILAWHGLALLAVGSFPHRPSGLALGAGCAFLVGSLTFAAPVALVAFGTIAHATIAPLGGTILLVGWLLFAAAWLHRPRRPAPRVRA